jgi:hypothetical protein
VKPLVFDGRNDALFHEFDVKNNRHMEYVRDRGWFADPPIDALLADFRATYPFNLSISISVIVIVIDIISHFNMDVNSFLKLFIFLFLEEESINSQHQRVYLSKLSYRARFATGR